MRKSTALLGFILLLLIALAASFVIGGTLSARLSIATGSAADYPQAFDAIRRVIASGAAPQVFADALPADASGYRLEDVTITLVNRGLFSAEWLYVEAEAAPGDVAVYSVTGEGDSIGARGTGTVNLKLITAADSAAERTYRVQYYVYGMKRTITVIQNGAS